MEIEMPKLFEILNIETNRGQFVDSKGNPYQLLKTDQYIFTYLDRLGVIVPFTSASLGTAFDRHLPLNRIETAIKNGIIPEFHYLSSTNTRLNI